MTDAVLYRDHGRVREILLNRPQQGNAFDLKLIQALNDALDTIDPETCEVVVFRGQGKGFCGGLDLSQLENETDASLLWRFVQIELLLQRIASMPQLTVALAHRFAFGAGADLFVACRRRIASPGTRFAFPGVRFGIALGTGRLSHCVGGDKARSLLASSHPIDLNEALACGLVQEQFNETEWDAVVMGLSKTESALNPRMSIVITKILSPCEDERDLADLVRSAAVAGLRDRIASYVNSSVTKSNKR